VWPLQCAEPRRRLSEAARHVLPPVSLRFYHDVHADAGNRPAGELHVDRSFTKHAIFLPYRKKSQHFALSTLMISFKGRL
jgi:hypothetical protein